ncbi:hypothetical protein ABT297_33945 [Dactylosporangium sp. NPDC000555]|uniref:hypothetical protein n=1 Tax=Dactylosporangium sp. NPDC000555 TaxID=3154260 RepID=UPI003328854F
MSSPQETEVGQSVATPAPEPTPAWIGSRVVTLVGALAALLALALPWAREDNTVTVATDFGGTATLLQRGGDVWTGWTLHGAGRLDGHRPVTVAFAMLLITATVVLAGAAWAAFERPRSVWIAPTMAVVAILTLIISVPGLGGVAGRFGSGQVTTVEFGVVVWRTALAVVAVGAARLALLQETSRRRAR